MLTGSHHIREGQTRRLRQFDRIVMNPPFSLDDWGYDDFLGGDPYDRFGFGMPPRDNGDFAWLMQVVKSLKSTGRAIIVMSQGVLFRGQPELTEKEDGRNQKPDAEHVIREGFVKADLLECVVVLPPKLFYGNNVPGCLIVLNKRKAPERKGKVLVIWASRNFLSDNPQNTIRRADCLRMLVPWRAFGELALCCSMIPNHEAELIAEIEHERDTALADIDEAYAPFLEPLIRLREEMVEREAFATREPPEEKDAKKKFREEKKANTERLKVVKREVKTLEKLEVEADEKRKAVVKSADREIILVKDSARDLLRICSDPEEARRYFTIVERPEVEENEFNLNVPRYVDTFEPEEEIRIPDAVKAFDASSREFLRTRRDLRRLLRLNGGCH
jgi:type I restriction enzyme M protein